MTIKCTQIMMFSLYVHYLLTPHKSGGFETIMKNYLILLTFCLSFPIFAADVVVEGRPFYDTVIQPRALEKLDMFRNTLEASYGHLFSDETVDWATLPQATFQNGWNEAGDWSFKKVLEQLTVLNVDKVNEDANKLYNFIIENLYTNNIMKKMDYFKRLFNELERSLWLC